MNDTAVTCIYGRGVSLWFTFTLTAGLCWVGWPVVMYFSSPEGKKALEKPGEFWSVTQTAMQTPIIPRHIVTCLYHGLLGCRHGVRLINMACENPWWESPACWSSTYIQSTAPQIWGNCHLAASNIIQYRFFSPTLFNRVLEPSTEAWAHKWQNFMDIHIF